MREAVGIPAGLSAYFLSTIILLMLAKLIFAAPSDWSNLITATTSIIAFKVMCIAVKNFSNATCIKIVAVMVALFWIFIVGIDVFAGLDVAIKILSGGQISSTSFEFFKELVGTVWNIKICAGVSVLLALWTLTE